MGSSFTQFQGRGFWSRDAGLELWLVLLAREVRQRDAPPSWLIAAAEDWHIQGTAGLVGCVTAGLDQYAATPEQVATILELSERTLTWLRSQGKVLSSEFLNSFDAGGPGATFTRDVPTEVFTRVGEAFIGLLKGEIVWDAATSPVL
jgi:hypothetical protein